MKLIFSLLYLVLGAWSGFLCYIADERDFQGHGASSFAGWPWFWALLAILLVLASLMRIKHWWRLTQEESGQDVAEYAVMLAVILIIVVATVRMIGSNANTIFSNAASTLGAAGSSSSGTP